MKEHAEVHKKASSIRQDERLIEKRVQPRLGSMKADAVTREDVMQLHQSLRDIPYEANRTLALLSKLFNLAELWRIRPDGSNPCRHVRRYKEAKRERFLSAAELGKLGAELKKVEESSSEWPGIVTAIRLLSLIGCRRGEILSARWANVDLDQGVLRLTDAKAGARPVPLGQPAIDLLKKSDRTSEFVVSTPDGAPISANVLEHAWRRIRTAAGIEDVRIHDLRHTVGTVAGQAGMNAFIVRDLLGHKTLAMTGRYVERDANPLRAAADEVSGRISDAMHGGCTKSPSPEPPGVCDGSSARGEVRETPSATVVQSTLPLSESMRELSKESLPSAVKC